VIGDGKRDGGTVVVIGGRKRHGGEAGGGRQGSPHRAALVFKMHQVVVVGGTKKGKPQWLPFLAITRQRLLTRGVDLDQRLIDLRWQRFAFTWNTYRRRRLGCGFLGCTQLFRIGRGERQAS
jgi:hypothetical protein